MRGPMERVWRIQLLGGLRATCGDRTVERFTTQRTGLLIAYLACYSHAAHPRAHLIELLWPEAEPESARQSLRQTLLYLRRQLEPADASANPILLADRTSIRLDPARVTSDVVEFQGALRKAGLGRSPVADHSSREI